jgi:hypothetical protein
MWRWLGRGAGGLSKGLHIVLDIAGTFDPTPICDTIHTAGCIGEAVAGEGTWTDAGLTALGLLTFIGDTAKAAKYTDEVAGVGKMALGKLDEALEVGAKFGNEAADGMGIVAKNGDNAMAGAARRGPKPQGVGPHNNKITEVADSVSDVNVSIITSHQVSVICLAPHI